MAQQNQHLKSRSQNAILKKNTTIAQIMMLAESHANFDVK